MDALTTLGEFGEAELMTESEVLAVVRAAVDAAGSLPVIVESIQTGTAARVAFARQIFDLGAAAIGVTVPVGFDELRFHHGIERLANALPLPIVLSEAPGLHRDSRSVDFVARLALEVPGVVSIRVDQSASARRVGALRERLNGSGRAGAITVFGRLEPFASPFDDSFIPDGVVIGLSFPEIARTLLDASCGATTNDSPGVQPSRAATVSLGQENDPALTKEVLRQRRLFSSSQVRHPGAPVDDTTIRYVRTLVDAVLSDADLGRIVDSTPRPFLVNI